MQSVGEHIRCPEGSVINNRYRVVAECGTGNFARVYKCVDVATNTPVAVKFLKREYARDATFEVDVLKAVTRLDPSGKEKVIHLLDNFCWNRYPCFVFPLRGATLKNRRYGVSTGVVTGGFTREEFATLTSDLIQAIVFLHTTGRIIHTDLKPENILMEASTPSTGPSRNFYIADFGSASFYSGKLEQDLISTRPYRCPEVVIGLGWSFPSDIWSLGCILFEIFTGQSLIPHAVHTDHDQLVCMQQRLGAEIPASMVARSKQRKLFDFNSRLLPSPFRREVLRPLREVLRGEDAFLDLLTNMLQLDPNLRIRADMILEHPFVVQSKPSSRSSSIGQSIVPPSMPIPSTTATSLHHHQLPVPSTSGLYPLSARVSSTTATTTSTLLHHQQQQQQQHIDSLALEMHHLRKGLQAPPPPHTTSSSSLMAPTRNQSSSGLLHHHHHAPVTMQHQVIPRREYGLYGLSR